MTRILPNWSDGPVRNSIVDFVNRITNPKDPDYVPPSERIATFDNDGTLWCEQPMQAQIFFAQDRLRSLAEEDPELEKQQPFKAFLEHDIETLKKIGKQRVFEVALKTHAGMTERDFSEMARAWLASARHPKFAWPFTCCVYQPQLELLDYLREHGFKIFIVSGGGIDLIRAFAEPIYGIPPEQVIGSNLKYRADISDYHVDIFKLPELGTFDDGAVKVENIALHIGRRPIFAFGNSDGDLPMLRYAQTGERYGLALLLHHDDGEREFAYDRDFALSPLSQALDHSDDYGIIVVSMQRDWKTVFVDRNAIPSAVTSGAHHGGLAD